MTSPSRNLVARIDGDASGFTKAVKSAERSAKVFERELKKLEARQTESVAHVTQMRARYEAQAAKQEQQAAAARKAALGDLGKVSMAAGAAMAAGVALSVRAALQWESAWAGVQKTVDGNAKQMAVLEGELRNLAKTLPASHQEIAAVAEAAGQLGVKRDAVAGFTKVMVDLGETTNLSADQAATSLARFMNIMGTAPEDVGRLGAALVDLGNNGASTEAEIAEMALRIAGAGKQVGLTEGEVLGFANALSSVGIEAEAGGSAFSRVLIDIAVAAETGGRDLDLFAKVAGVSADEFTSAFGQDAAGATNMFIDGLGRMSASGESTFGVLDELGLSEIRVRDALLRLSNAQGLAAESTRMGNDAWAANSALVEEANKRYDTTEAKLQIARNTVNDLAIDLGSTLLPALAGVAGGVADFAEWLSGLPDPVKNVAAVVGTLAAAIGLTGGAAVLAVPKVMAFRTQLALLATTAPRTAAAIGLVGKAAAGIGLALGAIIAVGLAVKAISDSSKDAPPALTAFTTSLVDFARGGELTGEAAEQLGARFENLGRLLEVANKNKLRAFDDSTMADVEEAREQLGALDETLASLITNGQTEEAARVFTGMTEAAREQGVSIDELVARFPQYGDELRASAQAADMSREAAYQMAEALGGVDSSAQNAYSSLSDYARAQGLSEEGTKKLVDQVQEWGDALGSFVEPLGAYTDLLAEKEEAERKSAEKQAEATESQKDSWEDYADAVSVSVGEYLGELEQQVQAQEAHADNMLRLAGRVSQGTLDELARMGPEGAPLVAQLVNASDAELDKLDDLYRRRTAEATGAMAGEMYLANVLLPQIASKVGQDTATALAVSLANGTTTVAQIARDYAWALQGGLAPLLKSLGAPMVGSLIKQERAQGNRRDFADGGFEDHRAQIAPAGAWRVWAEPETGGEAYIPLAPAKRDRSVAIWRETGRRLGVDQATFMAAGGFTSPGDVPRPFSTAPSGPPISTAGDGTMGMAYAEAVAFIQRNSLGGAGDLVSLGQRLQQMGFRVSGHAAFGGTPQSGHAPGSLHYRNRAIDVNWGAGGQSAGEMAAIDALMPKLNALRFAEKLWRTAGHFDHLHLAMAKGGILNPHVRDRGGPLLPGLTYNGTGRPEMVLPMAAGGITRPIPAGASLSAHAAQYDSPKDLSDLLAQWDRYLEQLDQAARRSGLLAAIDEARAEAAKAQGDDRARAEEQVAAAVQSLYDFDRTARLDAEREAVQALIDTLEEEAETREKAYREQVDINNNRFELGEIATADHLANLDRRMAREEKYSDAWMSLHRQQQAVLKDVADAREEAAEKAAEADRRVADIARDAAERATDRLNQLLDEQHAVRVKMGKSTEQFVKAEKALLDRQREAESAHFQALGRLAEAHDRDQRRLVQERQRALADATGLDQLVDFRRGLPTDWLVTNVQQQVEDLRAWMAQLDLAREMGISEAVITAMGLDEGPAALYQLKALTSSTEAEIDRLNAAVEAKSQVAGEQAAREQSRSLGVLGRSLTEAQEEYARSVGELQDRHREDMGEMAAELQLLQDDFRDEQLELSAELMAIGSEQGRSFGAALAQGLSSELPAVQAAARALQGAMAGLGAAQTSSYQAMLAAAAAAGMTPDQYAVSRGGGVLEDRLRQIFMNAGVTIATGTETESQRLGRIAAEVGAGRSLDSVRGSVAGIAARTAAPVGALRTRTVQFHVGKVVVQDPTDIDLQMHRAEFLVNAGSF